MTGVQTCALPISTKPTDIKVTYGPPLNVAKYSARNCTVKVPHRQIECLTAEGVGKDHTWQVSIVDLTSDPSGVTSSYGEPQIKSMVDSATKEVRNPMTAVTTGFTH